MPIARKQLPSPLTGEGSGGGEASVPSPIPTFLRQGGKGYVPPLSALALEEGCGEGIPAAWTRPASLTLSLSRREREAAQR
jgi:hypothetical protein